MIPLIWLSRHGEMLLTADQRGTAVEKEEEIFWALKMFYIIDHGVDDTIVFLKTKL